MAKTRSKFQKRMKSDQNVFPTFGIFHMMTNDQDFILLNKFVEFCGDLGMG